MYRALTLFFLLISLAARAEIMELAPGVTLDTKRFVQKLASCGPNVPGEVCLLQCYDINNQNTSAYYTCTLQATATFNEQINAQNGSVLYTGNTLTATDFRSQVVYPYQIVSICFNYGKEVVSYPDQPDSLWVFSTSAITGALAPPNVGGCLNGTAGPEPSQPAEEISTGAI